MLISDLGRKTLTYKFESDDNSIKDFFIDLVIIDNTMYEVYLYHKEYAVKDLMFGVHCKDVSYADLFDMIEANIEEYIHGYIEEHFD